MFDTKLYKSDYDRLNSLLKQRNTIYYGYMSGFHTLSFMYLAYFFRFRRITLAPSFALSCAYYYYFKTTNNIGYKLIVDNAVIRAARSMGYR